jgi:hypothetical protein
LSRYNRKVVLLGGLSGFKLRSTLPPMLRFSHW